MDVEKVQFPDRSPSYISLTEPKRSARGIVLVPQPSNDPLDPLNWAVSKKLVTLFIISLASFVGIGQAVANQAGFPVQAKVYEKTPLQLSYSVSRENWHLLFFSL